MIWSILIYSFNTKWSFYLFFIYFYFLGDKKEWVISVYYIDSSILL